MKSVAIVICYIGKLPWYFDYFSLSCIYNPSIDFIIVTDDISCKKPVSKNLKFLYKTLVELNDIATEKLGFRTQLTTPYKLNDFKPTYGLLFSDILADYDFWGYGDIDIIFGDIRAFITEELLSNYDLISIRDDYIPGCFMLFRNNEKMRMMFTYSKDYVAVFSNERHFCFDETNFHYEEFGKNIHYSLVISEVESMMHVVKKLEEQNIIKPYFDFHIIEGKFGKLSWNKGKLKFKNKYEAILYHLIKFKDNYNPKRNLKKIPESFNISPTRIYRKK